MQFRSMEEAVVGDRRGFSLAIVRRYEVLYVLYT